MHAHVDVRGGAHGTPCMHALDVRVLGLDALATNVCVPERRLQLMPSTFGSCKFMSGVLGLGEITSGVSQFLGHFL